MSFGESVFPTGFNQKTTKEDLIVKEKYGVPPRYLRGKTLEGSRSHVNEAGDKRMTYAAARPHYQAPWPPMGPPISQLPTSVFHHL